MLISPKAKKIGLYTIIGVGSLILLGIVWAFISISVFSSNKAKQEFQPFKATLGSLGATKLCDNGDSGHGIDNSTPWYTAYYSTANSTNLESQIITTGAKAGYDLKPDSKMYSDLKGLAGYTDSTYLAANDDGKTLDVRIALGTDQVALECGVKNYGQEKSPGNNQAILEFSFQLPDTRK